MLIYDITKVNSDMAIDLIYQLHLLNLKLTRKTKLNFYFILEKLGI